MKKRQRSDSISAAKQRFASPLPHPPSHVEVPEDALPFWWSLLRARAVELWTEADLENAANLARTKWKIEQLNGEIETEGDTITNKRGTPIANPKHLLLETLTRRVLALSKQLHVHAAATSGDSRDEKKASSAQKKTQETKDALDDLIPRPETVQ